MKKLLMFALVVTAAFGLRAASMGWGVDWVYSNYDSVNTYDDGSSVTYWIVALANSSIAGISVSDAGELTLGSGMTQKDTGSMDVQGGGALTGLGYANNGDYYTMVVYDAANGLYGVSAAQQVSGFADPGEGAQMPSSDQMVFQNDGEGYLAANTPVTSAGSPEPTSGLLLLIGGSLLALRRKQK